MRRQAYERIALELEQRIRAGEFPPGSRLPSRRMLCQEYSVSQAVIDKAMAMLRWKGLTETLEGVGVYVVEELPGE